MTKTNAFKKEFTKLALMPKELRWIGDPVLRKKTKNVVPKDIKGVETKKTINKLTSTLKKTRKLGIGVGLAAPQIGILSSVIVIYSNGKFLSFINPKITKSSKELNVYPEGCLSLLPLVADVVRPESIEVFYYSADGKFHKENFSGGMSRALQHEIDHLNGILFIEKADIKTARFVFDWDEFKKTVKLQRVK